MPLGPGLRRGTGRGQDNAGFTLIELLIVLFIISLMSAVVVLAIPVERGSLRSEAERFAARAKAASDAAVIGARPMSVRVTGAGYGFDLRQASAWQPIAEKPFQEEAWRPGTQALVQADGARLVFDATGMADAARIVLARDGERVSVDIGTDGKIDVRG